ncbi:MAG: anhydro-N-acetylmuramic acid kinase [Halofilum sp. (in: g-proteobacteria)]|nr:anhydro-N-acetylmuramic acid kinase [Halofilum sp. (in: g-proteobacteria)]
MDRHVASGLRRRRRGRSLAGRRRAPQRARYHAPSAATASTLLPPDHAATAPAPASSSAIPHRLAAIARASTWSPISAVATLAAGGQGAPLAPAFHAAAFAGRREARAVVNIGGIANVTLIAPGGRRVTGFDTGPGNCLLDAWIARHRDASFDRDGAWAAGGRVHAGLLEALLADPYFGRAPPKSTGREHFHLAWLERALAQADAAVEPRDVQATLAELTAITVTRALERHAGDTPRVLVCGGGARNPHLMARLAARLPRRRVESTEALGIDPGHVEPLAFAWLAQRRLRGLPGNRPEVTGAARPLVLGSLVRAPRNPYPESENREWTRMVANGLAGSPVPAELRCSAARSVGP